MKVEPLTLAGLLLIEPRLFEDERGLFYESYRRESFDAAVGRPVSFAQDNHSRSSRGVVRGLHYQRPPHAQGKLVRVVAGEIFDVAVDLRPQSATFGRWESVILSAANRRQLWIPEGFAHGFMALGAGSEVLYKTTAPYAPDHERAIRWDDPDLAIRWPPEIRPVVSPKDAAATSWSSTSAHLIHKRRHS